MSEPTWELLGGGGAVGGPIDYVGDWVAGTTYQPGQIVRYAGVDYLAVNPSVGQVPPLASPVPVGMVCIADQILSAPAANIDILNISQAYSHLKLVLSLRSDVAASGGQFFMRFNGDTGANYDWERIYASAAVVNAAEILANSSFFCGWFPANSAPAGSFGLCEILLSEYVAANKRRAFLAESSAVMGAATGDIRVAKYGGSWRSTAAVNRITIIPESGNWMAGCRATLYGLLSQGQAPPVTTLAPGGIGTSFPASPANGELFTLVDSLTAPTYAWDFRYVASITDAYKWIFVGGAPVYAETGPMESTASSTPTDLATVGPSIVVPRAGIYVIHGSAMVFADQAAGYADLYYKVGAAAATTLGSHGNLTVSGQSHIAGAARISALAGDTVKLQYGRTFGANASYRYRKLDLVPVRVS